ncbi:MAG: hypothetical protein DHS20C01_25370 [marine bacterium B5-7]|nr:MAG: hypothetical protein DHS20C01_25370 [marine bacterium B5-7]
MNSDDSTNTAYYDELDQTLRAHPAGAGLYEIHGMASALACQANRNEISRQWQALLGEESQGEDFMRVLISVLNLCESSLNSEGFEFTPLLPDENTRIAARTEALAEWCSGFVQAFHLINRPKLNKTANEALDDIFALTHIESDDRKAQVQSRDFAEIEEYLRVAVQLLFDECRGDQATAGQSEN